MPIILFAGATFVNKNSCLVVRIVSFDTASLRLRILEQYPVKDIELDLIQVISHDVLIVRSN